MRHLVNHPLLRLGLKVMDLIPRAQGEIGSVRKILVSNLGHLGDVVLATALFQPLHKAFSGAQIGFLGGSWAKDLVSADYFHAIDHYKHARESKGVMHYLSRKKEVVKEIKAVGYDLAIDTYHYFGNASHILYRANIPVRVGFTSGGLGNLYTHRVEGVDGTTHVVDNLKLLLEQVGIIKDKLTSLVPGRAKARGNYTILHPGAGDPAKRWDGWGALIEHLHDAHQLCVTGKGEKHLTDPISALGVKNYADQLSMHEWVDLIRGARCVIAIDSAIVHIAAACHVPCVAIYESKRVRDEWRGNSPLCYPLIAPTVEEVVQKVKEIG